MPHSTHHYSGNSSGVSFLGGRVKQDLTIQFWLSWNLCMIHAQMLGL